MADPSSCVVDWAIECGDIEEVQWLLWCRADVNQRCEQRGGATPLMLAVHLNDLEMVQLLLTYDANPNLCSLVDGTTPLLIACQGAFADIAGLLLNHRADPNIRTSRNDPLSALLLACRQSNFDLVTMLLRCGATLSDPQRQPAHLHFPAESYPYHKTADPLIMAAQQPNDSIDLVLALLAQGADGIKGNGEVLIAASGQGNLAISHSVLSLFGPMPRTLKRPSNNMPLPLFAAVDAGHLGIVDLLLKQMVGLIDINHPDEYGSTALIRACWVCRTDVLIHLLSCGADLHQTMYDGRTPLHCAVIQPWEQTMDGVRVLLECGVDLLARTQPAKRYRSPQTARQLISNDPPNEETNDGGVALLDEYQARMQSSVTGRLRTLCLIHLCAEESQFDSVAKDLLPGIGDFFGLFWIPFV